MPLRPAGLLNIDLDGVMLLPPASPEDDERLANALRELEEAGLSENTVRTIPFAALVDLLKRPAVVRAAKTFLDCVYNVAVHRHGLGTPTRANINPRVCLAGYMIRHHPASVFESPYAVGPEGVLVRNVMEAATLFLDQLESIWRLVQAGPTHTARDAPPAATALFQTALAEYTQRFREWKEPDENRLRQRISHALMALYTARRHLPPDEPADSPLALQFTIQIGRLREKMLQICGQAALDALDAAVLTLPDNHTEVWPGVGVEGRVGNAFMAHRLLLDPMFQLTWDHFSSAPTFARYIFEDAFWDGIVGDLQLPVPAYARVTRLVEEIGNGSHELILLDRAGAGDPAATAVAWTPICEVDANARRDLVDSLWHSVLSVTAAAKRQELQLAWAAGSGGVSMEAARLAGDVGAHAHAFCGALRFLLRSLNEARIERANARLRIIAPVIAEHGVDYERGKFDSALADGSVTLDNTHRWLELAVAAAPGPTALLRGARDHFNPDDVEFRTILATALAALVMPGDFAPVPETLELDRQAILDARAEAEAFIRSACDLAEGPRFPELMVGETGTVKEVMTDRLRRTLVHAFSAIVPAAWDFLPLLDHATMRDVLRTRLHDVCTGLYKIALLNVQVHGARYYRIIRENAASVEAAVGPEAGP